MHSGYSLEHEMRDFNRLALYTAVGFLYHLQRGHSSSRKEHELIGHVLVGQSGRAFLWQNLLKTMYIVVLFRLNFPLRLSIHW